MFVLNYERSSQLQLYFIKKLPSEISSSFLLPYLSSRCVCLGTRVFRIVWWHEGLPGCVPMGRVTSPCTAGLPLQCMWFRVTLCLCWWVTFFRSVHGWHVCSGSIPQSLQTFLERLVQKLIVQGLIISYWKILFLYCAVLKWLKVIDFFFFFLLGGWHGAVKPRADTSFFIRKKKCRFLTWKIFFFVLNRKSASHLF